MPKNDPYGYATYEPKAKLSQKDLDDVRSEIARLKVEAQTRADAAMAAPKAAPSAPATAPSKQGVYSGNRNARTQMDELDK